MAFLEVFDVAGSYKVELAETLTAAAGDSVVLGRSASVDIVIDDAEVSRRHLELRCLKDQWTVEDLGSANGTRVNGDELMGKTVLHNGDELRVGSTVIAYRDYSDAGSSTGKKRPAPPITKTERIVLVHLCRQYFSKSRRKAARSRDEIADAMFVGAPAVQAHLNNLYMKFDIDGERGTKRDLLAEKVIDMGVITPRDYPPVEDPTSS